MAMTGAIPNQAFPPPLMSQKIDIPLGSSIPLCPGPPGSMMMVRGGQNITSNMSYSNVVADHKAPPKPCGYPIDMNNRKAPLKANNYPMDNNIDERIRRSAKVGSPSKPMGTRIVQNSNNVGVAEEKVTVSIYRRCPYSIKVNLLWCFNSGDNDGVEENVTYFGWCI